MARITSKQAKEMNEAYAKVYQNLAEETARDRMRKNKERVTNPFGNVTIEKEDGTKLKQGDKGFDQALDKGREAVTKANNDSLKKVTLWINGIETNVVDSIAPYVLPWNTISYPDSSSHSITITAHDMSGNIAMSSPIQVLVDNRTAFPNPVNISSIIYTESEMVIKINPSIDDDFKGYLYLYSEIENGEKYLLSDTNFVQKDTILTLTNFLSDTS